MTIDNKLHDSAWKHSEAVMQLFIRTKRSPVVTRENKNSRKLTEMSAGVMASFKFGKRKDQL